jgi:hypothetical protein
MLSHYTPGTETYRRGGSYDHCAEWQSPSRTEDPGPVEVGVESYIGLLYFWVLVLILLLLAQWTHLI